jgi:mRNA interferase MazF
VRGRFAVRIPAAVARAARFGVGVPDRRDIIWIDCNPQVDREMRDVHPLLVLSPRAFNERTGLVIGLPMSTAAYNETNPFAVRLSGPRGAVSFVLAHQPKSFDWGARGARPHPWKRATAEVYVRCSQTLGQIVEISA